MKKLVLSLLLAAGTMSVFAQGTVQFANNVLWTTSTDQSRLVYLNAVLPGNELVGTQFRAILYYGSSAANLIPIAGTGNAFRTPGTTLPGVWGSPGTRTFVGFTAGDSITLVVRAWDSTGGFNTWESAAFKGESTPFSYLIPAAGEAPAKFFMEGLRAFAVVPEPGTFALGGLGLLGLCLWRRRK